LQPKFYIPHPALANYISHIMIVEAKFSPLAKPLFSPFPPTPQHAIHFYPRDRIITHKGNDKEKSTSPESVIVGPQVTMVNVAMGANHLIVSVAFQPGGLHRLLKMPLYELFDQAFDTTLLLGRDMADVNEQLKYALTHQEMLRVLNRYFLKKLNHSALLPWDRAMKAQLNPNNALSVEKAASLSCLSLRQFERKSKEVMGYSPKIFSRLIRFSKAYRLKESQPQLSWTNIAYTCGYFDQMHLIRDFKEFAGVLPGVISQQIEAALALLQEHLRF